MIRVYVIVEGQTEESFVQEVLGPTLWPQQIFLFPILLGRTGGNPTYARVKYDVVTQLKQDRLAYCSTMLDFYALGTDFPSMPVPPNLSSIEKVIRIEQAVKAAIITEFPDLRPDVRFLPYLQLHEYEGLLFSDPLAFAEGIYEPGLAPSLQEIRLQFASPEDIDETPSGAPSKRVLQLYPSYDKRLHGTLAALQVGITAMRQECPHFRAWLEQLETLA